jgi:hypothetical protein
MTSICAVFGVVASSMLFASMSRPTFPGTRRARGLRDQVLLVLVRLVGGDVPVVEIAVIEIEDGPGVGRVVARPVEAVGVVVRA